MPGAPDAAQPPASERAAWPSAREWVPDRHTVTALEAAVQGCRGCDLWRAATRVVPGSGPAGAEVMVVGEQPGDREDLAGEPFVGPAGALLDRALTDAGLDPGTVYRTNAVKHFRHVDSGHKRIHKTPTRWQVAQCQPWLLAELDAVRPRALVLLGATAGRTLLGPDFTVGAARGRLLPWPSTVDAPAPERVLATVHPAAVLRSRRRAELYEGLVADLRLVSPRAAPARAPGSRPAGG